MLINFPSDKYNLQHVLWKLVDIGKAIEMLRSSPEWVNYEKLDELDEDAKDIIRLFANNQVKECSCGNYVHF